MIFLRKILFIIPFIFFTISSLFLLKFFLDEPNSLISLDTLTMTRFLLLLLFFLLSSLYFVIFVTLASDWRLVLPVSLAVSFSPFLFFQIPTNLILASGLVFSFGLTYVLLERSLASYLTFQTHSLLAPAVKQLFTLLILISSIAFYLSSSMQINTSGFKLPDSLTNLISTVAAQQTGSLMESQIPQLTEVQLQVVKQNPSLLAQYGIDPAQVENLLQPKTQTPAQKLIKDAIDAQIQTLIKPYLTWIPLIFTLFFFLGLKSTVIFLYPLLYFLLWLTFLVLEKTGFTHYEIEMREVKKLIV